MMSTLAGALLLGIVAGMRTLMAPAALYLARGGVAGYALAVAEIGELVADALPMTPSRLRPTALAGRLISGAFTGTMLCVFLGAPPLAGAALGLVGAASGAYGGASLRAWLIARIKPIPAALTEDAIAILLAAIVLAFVSPLHAR